MRLTKTDLGQAAFKERSPLFSNRQRATFILIDGKKTVEEILSSTAGMGVTHQDLEYMVSQGLLTVIGDPAAAVEPAPPAASPSTAYPSGRTDQQRYQDAKPMATQLTAGLGLRGFRLNLSVESAAGYEDLVKLFPKIQEAVGTKACRELEQALKG
jgi:hypothetical protein